MKTIITIQPIQDTDKTLPVIGPDTALYMYQKYRNDSNFYEADKVKELIESGTWHGHKTNVSFTGQDYRVYKNFDYIRGAYS